MHRFFLPACLPRAALKIRRRRKDRTRRRSRAAQRHVIASERSERRNPDVFCTLRTSHGGAARALRVNNAYRRTVEKVVILRSEATEESQKASIRRDSSLRSE